MLPMLPIYIFGALSNALVSSINSRKQQAMQELIAERNIDAQRANLDKQLSQQRLLHQEGYKQQIANQLRTYALANTWPLSTSPSQIAEQVLSVNGNVPLYLIVAPVEQTGVQKEICSVWEELKNFLLKAFAPNSNTPVYQGKYKPGFPVVPQTDIINIFSGMKNVPTLYIAPYSTNRGNALGITIGFWGLLENKDAPTVQNFEIDFRKLYLDQIREDTYKYKDLCDKGILTFDSTTELGKNFAIFEEEKKYFEKGADFNDLDNNTNLYKNLRPSRGTYSNIVEKIVPIVKLLSVAIVDMYFVLEYGTKPSMPQIAQSCKGAVPDLRLRGVKDNSDQFVLTFGSEFLNDLLESYITVLIKNVDDASAIKYLPLFNEAQIQGALPYETKLLEARIPKDLPIEQYTAEQHNFMKLLQTSSGLLSEKTRSIVSDWKSASDKFLKDRPEEANCEIKNNDSLIKEYLLKGDYNAAFPLLKRIANKSPEAMFNLGLLYIKGLGVEKDEARAIDCLKRAGAMGLSNAYVSIYSILKTKSLFEALSFLKLAAEAKNCDAIYLLANHYLETGNSERCDFYLKEGVSLGDKRSLLMLNERKKQMDASNNTDRKAWYKMTIGEAGDALVDMIIRPFVREKVDAKVERLTFSALLSRTTLLSEKYKGACKCKCYIVFDDKLKCYRVCAFPVDAQMQTYGGEDVVMLNLWANSLDDKLTSFLNDDKSGKFLLAIG